MFGEEIDLRWEDCDAVARDGHVIALESPKPIKLIFSQTDVTCTSDSFVPYDTLPAGHSVSGAITLTQLQVVLRFQLKVNPFLWLYIIEWIKQTVSFAEGQSGTLCILQRTLGNPP